MCIVFLVIEIVEAGCFPISKYSLAAALLFVSMMTDMIID